jgi:predicted aspartyl protease
VPPGIRQPAANPESPLGTFVHTGNPLGVNYFLCGFAALALTSAASNGQSTSDIFYRQSQLRRQDVDERLLIAAIFGSRDAANRLRQALMTKAYHHGSQAEAWSFLCTDSYHKGDYQLAIADCTRAVAADKTGRWSGKDTLAMAQLLKDTPTPSLIGNGARVELTADGRIPVTAGDEQIAALADTGAQISVMMQSVADKAGVRIIGESNRVETTTNAVSGKVGVVARVRVGEAELCNLPVLVLPDAALTYEGGKIQLPFLLSLYAMRQFGRVAWLDYGKVLAFGDAAPPVGAKAVPVFWHPLGVGIPINGPGGRRAAHYDTGSNKTYLYLSGLPIVSKAEKARMTTAERKVGGVGGVVTEKIGRLPQLTLRIGGEELVLINVDVAPTTQSDDAARIGADVYKQAAEVVLDFERMLFSVRR